MFAMRSFSSSIRVYKLFIWVYLWNIANGNQGEIDTKIAATSDLHVDAGTFGQRIAEQLPKVIQDAAPDVFVIAGDISAHPSNFERVLTLFAGVKCHKLFVPGNHDIWVPRSSEQSSRIKYERDLPEICQRTGFHFLPQLPIVIEGVGFAGTIGWYDYSLRDTSLDDSIPIEVYRRKHYKGKVWNDVRYAKWGASDEDVVLELADQFKNDLNELEHAHVPIVAVTHHLPFRELVVKSGRPEMRYFQAFMGSTVFGDILSSQPNVKLVICGHTHFPRDTEINGLRVIASPLGYERERPNSVDYSPEDAIRVIDVPAL